MLLQHVVLLHALGGDTGLPSRGALLQELLLAIRCPYIKTIWLLADSADTSTDNIVNVMPLKGLIQAYWGREDDSFVAECVAESVANAAASGTAATLDEKASACRCICIDVPFMSLRTAGSTIDMPHVCKLLKAAISTFGGTAIDHVVVDNEGHFFLPALAPFRPKPDVALNASIFSRQHSYVIVVDQHVSCKFVAQFINWLTITGAYNVVVVIDERAQHVAMLQTLVRTVQGDGCSSFSVVTADLFSEQAVKRCLSGIKPPVAGVFVAIYNTDRQPFECQTAEMLEAAAQSKAAPARHVVVVATELVLDFVVLFSSAAAFWAVAYGCQSVVADTALDALAVAHQGTTRVHSIQFSDWFSYDAARDAAAKASVSSNIIDDRWALLSLEFLLLYIDAPRVCAVLPTRISTQSAFQGYSKSDYWERRYAEGSSTYDWYCNWQQLQGALDSIISDTSAPLLYLGAGNSELTVSLTRNGYDGQQITNTDISAKVVDDMQAAFCELGMRWVVDDICAMQFADSAFKYAIDKATMDAFLCSKDLKMVESALREISRVLKTAGKFIMICHSEPSLYMPILDVAEYKWSVSHRTVLHDHYCTHLYICTKLSN